MRADYERISEEVFGSIEDYFSSSKLLLFVSDKSTTQRIVKEGGIAIPCER